MKWISSNYVKIIYFILGSFVCYITLQISFFNIKTEIDVPSLLINILTIIVGVYIADVIQKTNNSKQNKHAFVISKLDSLWQSFNDFSEILEYNNQLEVSAITSFNKKVSHPISHLRNIFLSFSLSTDIINLLEIQVDSLEDLLSNQPSTSNIINFNSVKPQVSTSIININTCFSKILIEIQGI